MLCTQKSLAAALLAMTGALTLSVHAQDSAPPPVCPPLTGAIFTTDAAGNLVNGNVYDDCCDVYLNGGPPPHAPCWAAGLPDGNYYFQVTNPSGSVLLSLDAITEREVVVSGGLIVGYVGGPNGSGGPGSCVHEIGLGKCGAPGISIQLMPFAPTPNPGGVYKVWMTRVGDYDLSNPQANFGFRESCCKTDNFKCNPPPPPPGSGACCTGATCLDSITEDECAALGGIFGGVDSVCDEIECQCTPTIECPPDITIECGASTDPSNTGVGECGLPLPGCDSILSYSDEVDGCPGVITRTWRCTDVSDPSVFVECTQTITTTGATICASKFYDANMNGEWDANESPIENWPIIVTNGSDSVVGYTNASGEVCFEGLCPDGNYTVYETLPPGWIATTPSSIDFEPVGCSATAVFGNACLKGSNLGKTIGYWSNNNGKAVLAANDPQWRNALNKLNLRNANGTPYLVPAGDFATAHSSFRTWLLGANATNMAYMLSAQLAATTLNTLYKGLPNSSVLVVPGGMKSGSVCIVTYLSKNQPITCGEALVSPTAVPGSNACGCSANDALVTVGEVRAKAVCLLGAYGNTTGGGHPRTYQEAVKNLLDIINNNGNNGSPCGPVGGFIYLSPGPCPF